MKDVAENLKRSDWVSPKVAADIIGIEEWGVLNKIQWCRMKHHRNKKTGAISIRVSEAIRIREANKRIDRDIQREMGLPPDVFLSCVPLDE